MKGHLQIIDAIRTQLEADEFVNTVTEGSLFDIDLAKTTMFPLSHIIVNSFQFVDNVIMEESDKYFVPEIENSLRLGYAFDIAIIDSSLIH